MHIMDGVLPAELIIGGFTVTAGAIALCLRGFRQEDVPAVSVMTAGFFAASLVHIPIPPGSVHLILSGLLGVVLGRRAMPAILVGLLLQAVMFQHGGILSLGVNAVNLGLPALGAAGLYKLLVSKPGRGKVAASVIAGALSASAIVASSILVAAQLIYTGEAFATVARLIVLANLAVAAIEGVVTWLVVAMLFKIRPELLRISPPRAEKICGGG